MRLPGLLQLGSIVFASQYDWLYGKGSWKTDQALLILDFYSFTQTSHVFRDGYLRLALFEVQK